MGLRDHSNPTQLIFIVVAYTVHCFCQFLKYLHSESCTYLAIRWMEKTESCLVWIMNLLLVLEWWHPQNWGTKTEFEVNSENSRVETIFTLDYDYLERFQQQIMPVEEKHKQIWTTTICLNFWALKLQILNPEPW